MFDPLEVPNYGFQEAVRYLHVPNSTLHYWLRPSIGLLTPVDRQRHLFSFKNLVECYVLNGLREIHGVKISRIHHALSYLRRNFPSKHPLADYELKTDGRYIFFWYQQNYLNLSLEGQRGIAPVLDTYLRRIERKWQTGKWTLYPFMRLKDMRTGEDHPKVIAMNPKICFGMPVLNGTRITTATLASRYLGGDSVPALASSYGRPEKEIAEAISWETGQKEAA
jgi:uncharacterized protein (DUF433 family)/DNA-binding transcriptional MerR regulator